MRRSILALTLAGTAALGACAQNPRVAENAAIGAAGGAAVGAVVPGVSVIEGAAVGAAIGGLAGAVWADTNNDGYVDGYTYNGQYYAGTPQGYDNTTRSVVGGALGGAALGAAAGAVIPGVSILQGAVIGAAVGGLAGAVWADRNNDGTVDGYVYNGTYYNGAPAAQPHIAAREVIGPAGRLHHAPLPIHVVDLEGAPAPLGRQPRRQDGEQREGERPGPAHWLSSRVWPGSSMPLPATPLGWSVTTFRKSGSERKLLPFRC